MTIDIRAGFRRIVRRARRLSLNTIVGRCATRTEAVDQGSVEIDVPGAASGLVGRAGHVVTDPADRRDIDIAERVDVRVEGDAFACGQVVHVLGVGAFALHRLITFAVSRIGRVAVATVAGSSTFERFTMQVAGGAVLLVVVAPIALG